MSRARTNPWLVLVVLCAGFFMILLDTTIVNVAIPAMLSALNTTLDQILWVLNAYILVYAVLLITAGRLGDLYGQRTLFAIGLFVFTLASALCGLAQSAIMLDLSRVLQGAMAAMMYPQVLSVIQVTFPPHERARVFGLVGAVIGIATITGPLAGGLIIRDDITGGSWRWIFLVNLPIGIAALIAATRLITESRAPNASRLDVGGVLLATAGILLLVYPLVEGQVAGWPAWTFICMALSPVFLALFILYERSLPSTRFPLVQLSLFRIKSFSLGVAISAVFIAGIPAFFFTFSLMLQVGLGFSALNAGLTTIPWSLASAFASFMSARVAPRLGKWTIAIGSALLVIGMLSVIGTLLLQGTQVTGWELIPSFVISGLGLGTVIAPLLNIILAGVPGRDAGSASGVLTTFQQLGGAIGVAVVGVVFFGLLSSRAPEAITAVTPQLQSQLASAHVPGPQAAAAISKFTSCFKQQASSSDPSAPIPGCPSAGATTVSNPVSSAFATSAQGALGQDFVTSVERILWFNVGFWALTGVLSMFLPRARPQPVAGAAHAA